MTQPDSGDKLRKIAAKLTERGPMPSSILTSSDKPDSGDREATGTWGLVCPICWTGYAVGFEGRDVGSLCGDESQDQERACVGRLIHGRAFASAEWRQCVPVPLPLAQRILAALELAGRNGAATRDLAAELRAAVERKP